MMLHPLIASTVITTGFPKFGPNTRPKEKSAITQAKLLQKVLIEDALNPKTPPHVRAMIARAWSELEHRKRILRGIPDPGQFRPDLDATQLKRALKRFGQRQQGIIELTPTGMPDGCEPPEEETEDTSVPVPETDTTEASRPSNDSRKTGVSRGEN